MTTQNSLFKIEEEDEDILILRYKSLGETGEAAPTFKQRILQWFGRSILLVLGAATLAPGALHIAAGMRPWIFITFILWAFAYCAGMFNP